MKKVLYSVLLLSLFFPSICWTTLFTTEVSVSMITENKRVRTPLQSTNDATKIPYSMAAESLARWIYFNMSTIGPNGGRVFYKSTEDTNYYNGIIGNAGIGEFFIDLYTNTQNISYLAWAREVAIHLNMSAVREGNNTYWAKSNTETITLLDYQFGSAGIGTFLLHLDNAADGTLYDETFYLELVTGAANGTITQAEETTEQMFWNQDVNMTEANLTGFYKGAAGIGSFLLHAGEATGSAEYLNAANKTASWLITVADHVTGNETRWVEKFESNPSGNVYYYTDFSRGTAGIGHFFLEAGRVLSNITFIEYAQYAGNWLLNLGIPWLEAEGTTVITTNNLGNHLGASGIGKFFTSLYNETNREIYLERSKNLVRLFGGEIINRNYMYNETGKNLGVHWPDKPASQGGVNYTGLDATAGIVDFLTEHVSVLKSNETLLSNETWRAQFASDLVQKASYWLLAIADYDVEGMFMRITRAKGGVHEGEYYTNLFNGAAGIGKVLLKLGGPKASALQLLDFGSVQKGVEHQLDLTVTNLGEISLELTEAITSDGVFSVATIEFPITLQSGESEEITVSFEPTWEEEYEGLLNISTSDPTNPNLLITLKGEGWTAPLIEILDYDQKVTKGNFSARFNISDGMASPLFQVSYSIDDGTNRIIKSDTSIYEITFDPLDTGLSNHEIHNLTIFARDTENHQSSNSILFEVDIEEKDDEGFDWILILPLALVIILGGTIIFIAQKVGFLKREKKKDWFEKKEEDWFKKEE